MPKTPPAPLTTEQAIERARRMIESGQKLTRAADNVSVFRPGAARDGAEEIKEQRLLNYRVGTTPAELAPVLEALILAASNGTAVTREPQHAVR
jgi:hypothetical protein